MVGLPDPEPLAFLFDLDGTLIDSVYQHVLAWHEAAQLAGIELPAWRIHRQIGMSGGLILSAFVREAGRPISKAEAEQVQQAHDEVYLKRAGSLRVLPGATDLLDTLARCHVPHAIATSSRLHNATPALGLLKLSSNVPIITHDDVRFAKPDPDVFLTAGERLGTPMSRCVIVGDSVWDLLAARRAGALSIGLLSGGYGRDELERAGAYRVYHDPADLLAHLDEVGVRLDLERR